MISVLTNKMKTEAKHTVRDILEAEKDCLKGITTLSRKYQKLGRDFFFESKAETNFISNNVPERESMKRRNRIITFNLKQDEQETHMSNLLKEMHLNINIVKMFRIKSNSNLGNPLPLNVEFRNQSDRNTFFKHYHITKHKLTNIGIAPDIHYRTRLAYKKKN